MAKENGDLEHKRIFDKIVASNPSTVTLSEWHTFMGCGDREAAIRQTARTCKMSLGRIKALGSSSLVHVRASEFSPGEMDIHGADIQIGDELKKADL